MRRAVIIALTMILMMPMTARAEVQPVKITGYCLRGVTASGVEVREGICAYRKEDIGKLANVYNSNMELIGTYESEDTGKGGVRKGTVVDIWKATRKECFALTQYGFIEVVEKEDKDNVNDTGEEAAPGDQGDGIDGQDGDSGEVSPAD